MRSSKLSVLNQDKATGFMEERCELGEDKEKAVAAIVHEIRNPLTAPPPINMEPGTNDRMFDPDFSTKDGIAIRLSNVKEMMTLHRAYIVADSLPVVGTYISILFKSIPDKRNRTISIIDRIRQLKTNNH